jgi:hypothetical protein
MTLNISQELSANVKMFLSHPPNWAIARLYDTPYDFDDVPNVQNRVFVGLEWYLRSCRGAICETEALVDVAIALESLLRVRRAEAITERFKDAVLTLMGPIPRLDSWLEQFYLARSKAVHEGVPHDLMFYAVDRKLLKKRKDSHEDTIPHRSLIEYARRVFRLCLTSLLSSATQAQMSGFPALFVHNRERVEAICRTLNQKDVPPAKKILDIRRLVYELSGSFTDLFEPHVEVRRVLGAARLLLEAYKATGPEVADEACAAMDNVIAKGGETAFAQLAHVEQCANYLREELRESDAPADRELLAIVLTFLDYVTSGGFDLRSYLEDTQADGEQPSDSAGA